jgi:hypothetical protein
LQTSSLPVSDPPRSVQTILEQSDQLHRALLECWWVRFYQERRAELQAQGKLHPDPYPLDIEWLPDPLENFRTDTPRAWRETFEVLRELRGPRVLVEAAAARIQWSYPYPPEWVNYTPRDDEEIPAGSPWEASRGVDEETEQRICESAWSDFAPEVLRRHPLLRPWLDDAWERACALVHLDADATTTAVFKPLREARLHLLKERAEARKSLERLQRVHALLEVGLPDASLQERLREEEERLLAREAELRSLAELRERDVAVAFRQRELTSVFLLRIAPTAATRTKPGDWRRLVPDRVPFSLARSLAQTDTDLLFAVRQALACVPKAEVHKDTWSALREAKAHGLFRPRVRALADPRVPWNEAAAASMSLEIFQLAAYIGDGLALMLYYLTLHPRLWKASVGENTAQAVGGKRPKSIDPVALQNRYHRRFPRSSVPPGSFQPCLWTAGARPPGGLSPVARNRWAAFWSDASA